MTALLLFCARIVFVYMVCLFLIAQILRNNSVVDIGWGAGFMWVVWMLFLRNPETAPVKLTMLLLVTLWGMRLSVHVLRRNWGKGEDFRYAKWRREWGDHFVVKSFFIVFMLQGLFLLLISLSPIVVFASVPRSFSVLDGAGVSVFCIGILFETVGDLQLSRFLRNPENRGKLMTRGLWAWTRHPNYFGEATIWWGLFLIAVSSQNGWLALISPVTITVLLRFVSGVPLLEKRYEGRKDFEVYKEHTSVFVPFFHRIPHLFRKKPIR